MNAIIVRYQLAEENPCKSDDLLQLVRRVYGGAVTFVAADTIFIDTLDSEDEVFRLLEPMFTFDDKLFVGKLETFKSLHNISRTAPSVHKIAI